MWDAILEQMDNLTAVLLFVCGYLVSQFVERRKRRRDASIESARALVALLGQWQEALASLMSTLEAKSTTLEELFQAKAEFDARRGLAFQAEFHINVLSEDLLAARVIEKAIRIPMGDLAKTASSFYWAMVHELQGAYASRVLGFQADDPEVIEATRQQSISLAKANAKEFEAWCASVSSACGNFVGKRA